jgi:4-hydroxy-tetrahydrodipicolinate synthase
MITGSIVALITPMFESGEVDWAALEALLAWHIEEGTNAVVAVGTTGESATLSFAEHKKVVSQCVTWAQGRLPIIAGTGANNTLEALELTESALSSKADACLLVTPYYNKPTQEGLYQHFKKVAESVAIPQLLYNVPGRTGCDLADDTALRLAQIPNIVGIKDATGDLDRAKALIGGAPEGFAVYSGDDPTAVELMLMGGQGNISVTANVAPGQMAELCQLALNKEAEAARALNERLSPLHDVLFRESNPIPAKWALYEMGRAPAGIRLPLTPLAEGYRSELKTVLTAAGCLPQADA